MNTIKKIQVDGVDYDIQSNELTKVTYAELKEMRDNGSLEAGHLYRITDYEFTTTQTNTKSAGHPFDVIVLATTENQLSELARAIQHEGDTYFNGNDLGAWELWYDLDNDTNKYEWADTTNGKGVIYRMIDEKRNDCPYDFKNALFYNAKITSPTTSDKYYYTFSYVRDGKLYDGTVEVKVRHCYANSMGFYIKYGLSHKSLNFNVFRCDSFNGISRANTFGPNCYNNTFGSNCYCNTFGNDCNYNTVGSTFVYNTFGNACGSNTFGNNCSYNTVGSECSYNTFMDDCRYNILGGALLYRTVNNNKTSVTLNDKYFDDGSGQLVPIKHPDLSTQPSILPYKFMGQYVYEQLIPVTELSYEYYIDHLTLGRELTNIMFLEATAIYQIPRDATGEELKHFTNVKCCCPAEFEHDVAGIGLRAPVENIIYYKIVYTFIPDEGDYYGYNNY